MPSACNLMLIPADVASAPPTWVRTTPASPNVESTAVRVVARDREFVGGVRIGGRNERVAADQDLAIGLHHDALCILVPAAT